MASNLTASFWATVAGFADLAPRLDSVGQYLTSTGTCCAALSLFLPGKVAFPSGEAYLASRAGYWSLHQTDVAPTCIVRPQSSEDVATAVSVLGKADSWVSGICQFAVKGGGHTPWAGASSIQDGITIDLRLLNQVTVAGDRSSVTIGPGNTWGSVYSSLPAGLATGGGRVSTVGVGGLVTGGGLSFFSARKGFVCDTVNRFEVVLASGEIVNATKDTHRDLWLALKGGSNNFGIVTAIEQDAFEQSDFWGGFIYHDASTFEAQYKAFETITGDPNVDPYAALIMNVGYQPESNSWIGANMLEYTKPQTSPSVFKDFMTLPSIFSSMRISNITDFTAEVAATSPPGVRAEFVTATYLNSAQMLARIVSLANETVQDLRHVSGLAYSLSFQPQSSVFLRASARAGGNSLGLGVGDAPLFNLNVATTWQSAADDELVHAKNRELHGRAEAAAEQLGLKHPYVYLNYAAAWQDPIAGYGEDVKRRLQATSKKYDPRGMFQRQVPGGFKLFT